MLMGKTAKGSEVQDVWRVSCFAVEETKEETVDKFL